LALTGQTKSSATTMTNSSKNSITLSGIRKAGQGWDYDDPSITYDSVTDPEGRQVYYDSVGSTITLTPLTKNNA
jgi:hypothetical protein